jgi:hypothetical protein
MVNYRKILLDLLSDKERSEYKRTLESPMKVTNGRPQ